MKRRSFIKKGTAAASLLGLGAQGLHAMSTSSSNNALGAPHNFNLKYAPHFGMFKNHAGNDLIDQINFMADQGFTAFEDNGMMKRTIATQIKIGETLAKRNMTMGVFVVDKGGNMANNDSTFQSTSVRTGVKRDLRSRSKGQAASGWG